MLKIRKKFRWKISLNWTKYHISRYKSLRLKAYCLIISYPSKPYHKLTILNPNSSSSIPNPLTTINPKIKRRPTKKSLRSTFIIRAKIQKTNQYPKCLRNLISKEIIIDWNLINEKNSIKRNDNYGYEIRNLEVTGSSRKV